jgi:hypothetical protein
MNYYNRPTTIERFVATHLTHARVEPHLSPAITEVQDASGEPRSEAVQPKASFAALAWATTLFACGVAVGYLISDYPQASPLSAHISEPGDGAMLRIDYDLGNR